MNDRSAPTERLADWLGHNAPWAYRVARPPWRALRSAAGGQGYWERRRGYAYYGEVVRIAREQVPGGGAVLDVGSHETELLQRFDWFGRRVALDVRFIQAQPGVEAVVADFMDYEADQPFDLVLCLQVLEHLRDPAPFARKLLGTGRTVIVSVPNHWPAGIEDAHVQDPVDAGKLRGWMGGREPLETKIVDDGKERLIAVYAGDAPAG